MRCHAQSSGGYSARREQRLEVGDDGFSITLNFGEYKYIYTEQKPDGSKGAAPEFAWDIAANEKK